MYFITNNLFNNQKTMAATAKRMILTLTSSAWYNFPFYSFSLSRARRRKICKIKSPFPLPPALLLEPTYYTHEDTGNLQRPLWKSFLLIF